MIQIAVILAAGLGSRLPEVTKDRPKGFLTIGDMPIIEESILKLIDCGIENILIGTGYKAEYYDELSSRYPQVTCIYNELYATTGSMYTLYMMKDVIIGEFLLLESDLIYDKEGLRELLQSQLPDVILTSGITHSDDEVYVEVTIDDCLANMSKDKRQLRSVHSELVGISKISYITYQKMCEYARQFFQNNLSLEYEQALVSLAQNVNISVLKIEGYVWTEIDNSFHLSRAKDIYKQIQRRENDG